MGFLVALLALAGCDGGNTNPDGGITDSGPTPDSGPAPDGGPRPDGGPPTGPCESARAITLTLGEQTLTGDTTGRSSGLSLSADCGGAPAPQEVLELTVPGSGQMSVGFDLVNDATMFDTVIEVRTGACTASAEAQCFDDTSMSELRSTGSVLATGGSTLYFVVTGFGEADAGPWAMTVNVSPATAPTLTGVDAARVGSSRYELLVDGMDAEGDAAGAFISFLDASGTAIAVEGRDTFGIAFAESQAGVTTLADALIRIFDPVLVAATADATEVRVDLVDDIGLASGPMTFALRNVAEVGDGGTCNADSYCALSLECDAGTCRIPAATATACGAATALTVSADAPATTTGSIPASETNLLTGTCGLTTGPEAIYTVTIGTAGTFDLVATTDNDATGEADTVVYVQRACGDLTTELACNDDAGDAVRSTAIVNDVTNAQTYTLVVENYGPPAAETSFQLDLRLRPVIGAGEACDPTGEANRCSTAACPTGVASPTCPAAP
jgi:hypothetical protein